MPWQVDSFQDDYISADGDSELPIVLAACLTSIGQLLHRFAELSRVKAVGLSYNCINCLTGVTSSLLVQAGVCCTALAGVAGTNGALS